MTATPNEKAVSLEALVAERLVALHERIRAARTGDKLSELGFLAEELVRLHDTRLALQEALRKEQPGQEKPAGDVSVYMIGSRFVRQSYRFLMEGVSEKGGGLLSFGRNRELEHIHGVTGVRDGGTAMLAEIVPLEMASQSAGSVEVDTGSLSAALEDLQESGHVLWAIFHSHRMKGPPQPSSVDMQLQRKLEAGGYKAIQAVFVEDGFVRFFAASRSFEVVVYGKGVEKLEDKLFRIVDL